MEAYRIPFELLVIVGNPSKQLIELGNDRETMNNEHPFRQGFEDQEIITFLIFLVLRLLPPPYVFSVPQQ